MPDDPLAVVERLNATINAKDLAAGRALYAEDARLVAGSGRTLDLDGLDAMLQVSFHAFPDMDVRIERVIEQGDTVVTEEVMSGTHKGDFAGMPATMRRVELPMVHITRVKNGRIVERVAYHDTAGILRALTEA